MRIFDSLKNRLIFFQRHEHVVLKTCLEVPTPVNCIGPLTLLDVFECLKKYQVVMNILKNRGMITEEGIWIDNNNGKKGVIVGLIRCFHDKGYYKENKILTNAQIREIAFNTFGIIIGIDHIKHTTNKKIGISYIPYASQVMV